MTNVMKNIDILQHSPNFSQVQEAPILTDWLLCLTPELAQFQ